MYIGGLYIGGLGEGGKLILKKNAPFPWPPLRGYVHRRARRGEKLEKKKKLLFLGHLFP